MSAARDVLAVIGLITTLLLIAFAVLCVVMVRRGREAHRYRDEMQEQG